MTKKIIFNSYKDEDVPDFDNKFLGEEEYKNVLDSFVIACTDIVMKDSSKEIIYLAYRKNKPIDGWWIIGGRRKAGKLPQEAVSECFKRETSLEIPPERFHLISINEYIFKKRQQKPNNKGSHALSHTFVLEINEDEMGKISEGLAEEEFDKSMGLQGFDRARLVSEGIHQSLIDLYDIIFS